MEETEYLEITITEQDLEWMWFQQELTTRLCAIFGIPVQLLGLHDGQVVNGTIQALPLTLPAATIEE